MVGSVVVACVEGTRDHSTLLEFPSGSRALSATLVRSDIVTTAAESSSIGIRGCRRKAVSQASCKRISLTLLCHGQVGARLD